MLYSPLGVEDIKFNFLDISNVSDQTQQEPDISEDFLASPWYRELTRTKERSVKLKSSRYCTINGFIHWKDPGGVLLNYLLETKVREKMNDFHKKDCGGHLFWKTIAYKILTDGFYCPTLFLMCIRKYPLAMSVKSLRERGS